MDGRLELFGRLAWIVSVSRARLRPAKALAFSVRLSGALKRVAPNLRQVGVEVEFGRTGKGRFVILKRSGP